MLKIFLKFVIISICINYSFADRGGDKRPIKAFHELYELNVGTGEGSFMNNMKIKSLTLYRDPNLKSHIVHEVEYVNRSRNHQADFYRLFDDKSGVYYFKGIYSRERKGDFYKVFYKGEYFWTHKTNYQWITNVEKLIMDHRGIDVDVTKVTFYRSPKGEIFEMPEPLKRYSKNRTSDVSFLAKEYRWLNGRLWVKLAVEKGSCSQEIRYSEKLEFWYTPYKKGERPNYHYAKKSGC